MSVLQRVKSPSDLRKLSIDELQELAKDMRSRIFDAVSKNGGHLASNLGVVELTIALHYVYDFGPHPKGPDRLLFDVGHQCYPHKLLTGRAGMFDTLRKKGSVGGFPMPDESPYDLFAVGHAGTAVSTAVGMARAGTLERQLRVGLNDNGMGTVATQGAWATYHVRVRVGATYDEAKDIASKLVGRLPTSIGTTVESVWHHLKEGLKHVMWPGQIF